MSSSAPLRKYRIEQRLAEATGNATYLRGALDDIRAPARENDDRTRRGAEQPPAARGELSSRSRTAPPAGVVHAPWGDEAVRSLTERLDEMDIPATTLSDERINAATRLWSADTADESMRRLQSSLLDAGPDAMSILRTEEG